jgi:transposase
VKTDLDPRVRHRAPAVLIVALGTPVVRAAREFAITAHSVRAWRDCYLRRGCEGLADAPRSGRPPKLGPADLAFLAEALVRGPQHYGWPVTIWSVRELRAFLGQQPGVQVSVYTVNRPILALGYRYHRPRHDLRHRQDHEAVASMKEVLAWLGKGRLPGVALGLPRRVRGPPTLPGWQKSGSNAAAS